MAINRRSLLIEHAGLPVGRGIIVHQTGGATASSALDSDKKAGANGAHFLIDKDGTSGMHKSEMAESVPDRYPGNGDGIGIELVGRTIADPKDKTKDPVYDTVTAAQNASLKWLVAQLTQLLGVPMTEVFRHPEVSRKTPSEAQSAVWKMSQSGRWPVAAPSHGVRASLLALRASMVGLAALVGVSACSVADAGCTAATEFNPRLCDARPPPVRSVTVENNAIVSEQATEPVDCSAFVLDAAAVRRYFVTARRVDASDPAHAVDWSACQATGTLRLVDGRSARWRIEQIGVARLSIAGADPLVLYCPDCDFARFMHP